MTRVIDPYDELASLFLTSGPTDAPLRPLHAGAIKEILIVGHLPVRAGLWLTPYADARARQVGAVALLRFDVPETSLQILRAPQRIADAKDPKSLEEAVHLVASSIALWVIRPGTDCNADALIKLNPDRITLLSSADDAAVINAYQVLKSLADAANRAQCAMPSVGLAVVGAESKSAAITIDRLNRTATANLNLEISLDLCLPRMDAGIRSTRYMSFPASASAQNSANAPPSPINALATISQAFNWITAAEKDAIHIPEPIPFPVQTPLPAPVTPPPMRPAASAPQPTIESPKPRAEAQPQQVEPPASQVAPTSAQPPAMSGVASQPSITTQSTTGVQPAPHKLAPKQPCLEELKEPARASEPDVQGKPLGLTGCVEGLIALPF
ncbi:MAG TPA: hypothetical protein VG711_06700, partial [Phycisphaerales bacterium]|nr:hypothetical protein [Phycisphaerales bacterium]